MDDIDILGMFRIQRELEIDACMIEMFTFHEDLFVVPHYTHKVVRYTAGARKRLVCSVGYVYCNHSPDNHAGLNSEQWILQSVQCFDF